jgi:hypothetical protein
VLKELEEYPDPGHCIAKHSSSSGESQHVCQPYDSQLQPLVTQQLCGRFINGFPLLVLITVISPLMHMTELFGLLYTDISTETFEEVSLYSGYASFKN